jgi:SAM-dependent methyltransferase
MNPTTHEQKIAQWIGSGKFGAEIGAGGMPLPGFSPPPIQVDCFKEWAGEPCQADYYGHAAALPFHDNALDYVASSHVLQYAANPVAALAECHRVLKPGGILYLVVPDRRFTCDHTRALTPVQHMIDDFVHGTTASDATHIQEYVYDADWSLFRPSAAPFDRIDRQAELAAAMRATVERGENINIRFHTFEPASLLELLAAMRARPHQRFRWEVLEQVERFPEWKPDGFLTVIRANKGWRDRAEAEWLRVRSKGEPRAALRDDAEPFADFVRNRPGMGGVR